MVADTAIKPWRSAHGRWWAALVVALLAYPWWPALDTAIDQTLGLPMQLERLLVSMFVFALLALAVHVHLGLAGMMQLGSAALYGVGAYTFGLATVEKLPLQLEPWRALGLCALMGALWGGALGVLCARVRGDAVGMLTLAFAEIWRATALNAEGITDGSRGLNPLPSPSLPMWLCDAWPGGMDAGRAQFVALYSLALLTVVALVVGLEAMARGPLGRALSAMRADPLAAEMVGLSVWRLRAQAMAVGGAIAGAGGGLYAAYLTTTAEPNTYDFNVSVMALCAVVLGGLGSALGAVLGAAFVVFFDTALGPIVDALVREVLGPDIAQAPWASFGHWRWLVFGTLLIVTMQWRPQGLLRRAS